MKKIKVILGIIIVLVLVFAYAHIEKMNIIYDKHVDSSEYLSMGPIGGNKVEQSFLCGEDALDGVYVKCLVLGDVEDVVVKYTLTDQNDGRVLVEGNCLASEIKGSRFNTFSFDRVEGCKDKKLLLTIWSESADEDKGVTFYFQPMTEKGTKLIVDGNETQGTMIMKTITNRFDIETFCVLLIFIGFVVVFMKILYRLFK